MLASEELAGSRSPAGNPRDPANACHLYYHKICSHAEFSLLVRFVSDARGGCARISEASRPARTPGACIPQTGHGLPEPHRSRIHLAIRSDGRRGPSSERLSAAIRYDLRSSGRRRAPPALDRSLDPGIDDAHDRRGEFPDAVCVACRRRWAGHESADRVPTPRLCCWDCR